MFMNSHAPFCVVFLSNRSPRRITVVLGDGYSPPENTVVISPGAESFVGLTSNPHYAHVVVSDTENRRRLGTLNVSAPDAPQPSEYHLIFPSQP